MSGEPSICPRCGSEVPPDALNCPSCSLPIGAPETPERPDASASPDATESGSSLRELGPEGDGPPSASELTRRLGRLQQWAEAAIPLSVSLPALPSWAEASSAASGAGDQWAEVVRGVERIAQRKIVQALEEWERQTRTRLSRLEAYSVDGRLEHEQMDDVLHAARAGDVTTALATYQQVDRVVALKERHLDQAREELEKLISLLRDMESLGLRLPSPPEEVSQELERELRGGRLAALKQQLRATRQQALGQLKRDLPDYIARYGEALVRERSDGTPVDLEVAELARGAREFARGRPEEALRRLRLLAQVHGGPVGTRSVRTRSG
ncbi:MAG: hypothetical protein L3K09_01605 [Thermoplasmata archaeon]|nr:hypothetical protein [Thermoplasmata archaeon]